MKNQLSFAKTNWNHRHSHGGTLRNEREGRGMRALSSREPIHLVLKANKGCVRQGFRTYKRYFLIHQILKKYAFKFYINVEQISVQGDHMHLLIRASRRSNYQSFFRVFAGQIAQQFEKEGLLSVNPVTDTPKDRKQGLRNMKINRERKREAQHRERGVVAQKGNGMDLDVARGKPKQSQKQKLWKYRPFSRVIRGWKAYKTVRDYIQLNEKEARNEIAYKPQRLKGLSAGEWQLLWS